MNYFVTMLALITFLTISVDASSIPLNENDKDEHTANILVSELLESKTPLKQEYSFSSLPFLPQKVLGAISGIEIGTLTVELLERGIYFQFKGTRNADKSSVIQIEDLDKFAVSVATRGEIGLAESYMLKQWSTSDIRSTMEILKLNADILANKMKPSRFESFVSKFAVKLYEIATQTSKDKALENLQFNYDLGSKFYSHVLDESLAYSGALFDGKNNISLKDAQEIKYNRILDNLGLNVGDKILDMRCDWGGFAAAAATRGYKVVGITPLQEQCDYATKLAYTNGFSDKATFFAQNYQTVQEQYDAIVAIEMFEHVGKDNWDNFFKKIYECLKPGKKAILQIVFDTEEKDFEKRIDAITSNNLYICPDLKLATATIISKKLKANSLTLKSTVKFGKGYASTLTCWYENLQNAWPVISKIDSEIYNETFKRCLEYFFSASRAAFVAGSIDVYQLTVERQ